MKERIYPVGTPLSVYRDRVIKYRTRLAALKGEDYDAEADPATGGAALELAMNDAAGKLARMPEEEIGKIHGAGKTDMRIVTTIGTYNVEIKQGSFRFTLSGHVPCLEPEEVKAMGIENFVRKYHIRLCYGSSLVAFVPHLDYDLPLERQEGFVGTREDIFDALVSIKGMIRYVYSKGNPIPYLGLQVFWNWKQDKPVGRKLMYMLDTLYNKEGITPLDQWLAKAI